MTFLNDIHENKYMELVKKTNLHPDDSERKSLFYIIAGNSDLFEKKSFIYDFFNNCIKPNFMEEKVYFCSSSKSLIRLGFNLYNGYTDEYTNPLYILGSLDPNNFIIANNAINIRFKDNSLVLAFDYHGG